MVGPLASTPPSTNALQTNHSHPTTSHHRLVCMSTPQLPRHDTFQSDDTFSLSLYVRDLDPADVAVAFRERAVCLATGPKPVSFFHAAFDAARWFLDADSLPHIRLFLIIPFPTMSQVKLTLPGAAYEIGPLAHAIVPDASTYRVSKHKIELNLHKKHAGVQWNHFQGEEAEIRASWSFCHSSCLVAVVDKSHMLLSCCHCQQCRHPTRRKRRRRLSPARLRTGPRFQSRLSRRLSSTMCILKLPFGFALITDCSL